MCSMRLFGCEYDFNENYHCHVLLREISSLQRVINLICLTKLYRRVVGVRLCVHARFIIRSNFVLILKQTAPLQRVYFVLFENHMLTYPFLPWKCADKFIQFDITWKLTTSYFFGSVLRSLNRISVWRSISVNVSIKMKCNLNTLKATYLWKESRMFWDIFHVCIRIRCSRCWS